MDQGQLLWMLMGSCGLVVQCTIEKMMIQRKNKNSMPT
jgi:hypothetical protein